MTRSAAYLYPWDVDGDPDAPKRIADLGIQDVVLAAAYHSVRAVTPFHPQHRIVTRNAGVYYRPAPERWRGLPLRPAAPEPSGPQAPDPAGSFERAAEQLRAADLRVAAWVVVAHSEALAAARPEFAVHNAFGDRYPWALCIASPDVRDYAATLTADVAALPWVDGIELEACGWYGFGHLSAHDKTGGQPAGAASRLLDICFCPSCEDAYRGAGLNPGELRGNIRAAADAGSAGPPAAAGLSAAAELSAADELPSGLERALDQVRAEVAADFLRDVIASARAAAPGKPVLVHSHPDPRETGANPGFDPAVLLGTGGADGVVLACPGPPAQSANLVSQVAARAPGAPRIAANLTAVTALGGRPAELRAQAEAALSAGATELRFYHAGLASPADLAAIRDVTGAFQQSLLFCAEYGRWILADQVVHPLRALVESRREQVRAVAARHHASRVRLFGSVARGEERPDSDIDLLVDFDHDSSLFDLMRMTRELEDLLGHPVDVVSTGGLKDRDREILAESVDL